MSASEMRDIVENLGAAIVREVAIGLGEALIAETPVRTGKLVGGWQAAINSEQDGPENRLGREAARADLHQVLSRYTRAKSGDKIVFKNSVVYAFWVNYGTRYQPAQHFVERAIQSLDSICRAAAIKVSLTASPPVKVG